MIFLQVHLRQHENPPKIKTLLICSDIYDSEYKVPGGKETTVSKAVLKLTLLHNPYTFTMHKILMKTYNHLVQPSFLK